MTIAEKIISSIKNNRMTLENKVAYLEVLKRRGIDLNNLEDEYISPENIIVKKVVNNIKKYYKKNMLKVKQIIKCETLGIKFDNTKKTIDEKIKFLKNAIVEGIDLDNIILENDIYNNTSVLEFINDLRNDFDNGVLNEAQTQICMNELKIILSVDDKKEIIINKMKDSALKNVVLNDETRQILE